MGRELTTNAATMKEIEREREGEREECSYHKRAARGSSTSRQLPREGRDDNDVHRLRGL